MLIMRSTADLHTRARIRDAAVARFGAEGFDVGLRAIAEDAGVSAALILHHYGSKAGLRAACDEHVQDVILTAKLDSVSAAGPEQLIAQLAQVEEHAPLAAYAVASLAAGGTLARNLLEQLTGTTLRFLRAGVAAGTVRPSRDEAARARYLTESSLGHLLLRYRLAREAGTVDLATLFEAMSAATTGPALELFTAGLFTDDRHLRAFDAAATPPTDPPGAHG